MIIMTRICRFTVQKYKIFCINAKFFVTLQRFYEQKDALSYNRVGRGARSVRISML